MMFDKYQPSDSLKPYIKYYVVSENNVATHYKVLPVAGMVIGFQYKGQLNTVDGNAISKLSSAGITGIADRFKIFRNSANIGTVLVYFTETGFFHFASIPANELFNQSVSLEEVFDKNCVQQVEEKLAFATTHKQRIETVEQFLWEQHKYIETDKLITEAISVIKASKGSIRIKELTERLHISQSPFEKRFRKIVGCTPKKFVSIIRFKNVIDKLNNTQSLLDVCYENDFFDPAHFSHAFKQYTGETPENFKRLLR